MSAPDKPFSCLKSGCGESFTNEDRLAVHAKKHDMELQLGHKGEGFVADQTPTPTRFIRNCEEVGLFQDLQNVNPFEETFKRAIESKVGNSTLNLESSLVVTNTDDTLHTPHIFPNLCEENTANTDNRIPLHVERSSSDDTNNHLSVPDLPGLLQIERFHKNNEKHIGESMGKIKKMFPIPKVKLRRQESIDLGDEIGVVPILDNLITSELKENNLPTEIKNVQNNISCGNIQIPVISISEIAKSDESNEMKPKAHESDTQSSEQKAYLNVDTCIKNFPKVISQKSIELALANFTHEAQNKLIDMNNISIEDIPENSAMLRDNSRVDTLAESHNMVHSENQSKEAVFSQNITQKLSENINLEVSSCTHNKITEVGQSKIPIIEIADSILSADTTQKGYEVILKWPDGKQIYLKEINRDSKDVSSNIEEEASASKNIINSNVKRKLKDMITINTKKMHSDIATSGISPANYVLLNTHTIIPENIVMIPQTVHTPKLSMTGNSYNIVPITTQVPYKRGCEMRSRETVNSTPQPVIRTVLNGKICEATTLPQPLPNVSKKSVINRAHNYSPKIVKDTKQNIETITQSNIPSELIEKKKGNRAAVFRYRLKNKQKQKQLVEQNEKLKQKNNELNELLKHAYNEINILKRMLVNTNSRVERPLVIDSNRMNVFNKSSKQL